MKTSELTGAALDWAVAKCEEPHDGYFTNIVLRDGEVKYSPSTDWSQGGPIMERECIEVVTAHKGGWMANRARTKGTFEVGSTPLVAAMRCYVASKLGDEVEIPEELA